MIFERNPALIVGIFLRARCGAEFDFDFNSVPCYRPITAYRSRLLGKGGKAQITFKPEDGVGFELQLPCAQCIGCRLEKSRQWAMRCMHEASLYESNCFITLTYGNEHLPKDGSLNKKHFQDFMKRLRARFPETKIRYYHCGEYGTLNRRPHYHALLFNFDFGDKTKFSEREGQWLYTSTILDDVWGMGHSTIGDVTFESAAYVARYIMKKITGDAAQEHYTILDPETGELHELLPEYATMSRRPGIGRTWLEKFGEETFRDDFVIIRGKRMKPPRYYDLLFEVEDPEEYERLKSQRRKAAYKHADDQTWQRLRTRETVKNRQVSMLKRTL